jgi:hypothetical protein
MNKNKILNAALFLALMLLDLALIFILVAQRRLVVHDTFMRFSLQYFYLNHTVHYKELPQWFPFITHGVSSYFYIMIAGVNSYVTNILFYISGFVSAINFNSIFYGAVFLDKLLFLVGIWLLGRKYYRSVLTQFFVACSILGACVWTSQIYFNLYFVYLLPLILYCLHNYLDTHKNRYLCLGGCLFLFQIIGNLIYFMPILSLTVAIYFLAYLLYQWKISKLFALPALNLRLLIAVLSVLLVFAGILLIVHISYDPQYFFNDPGRGVDGKPTLYQSLVYVNKNPWTKWIEALWGFSLERDYTLYSGLLLLPLSFIAVIANRNKYSLSLFIASGFLFLYSTNYFFNAFFYYWWPFIKFYRHHHLVVAVMRIFLCFLAGFGFEYLFQPKKESGRKVAPVSYYALAVGLFLLTGFLYYISRDYPRMVDFIRGAGFDEFVMPTNNRELILGELVRYFSLTGIFAAVYGTLFLIYPRLRHPKQQAFFLFVILFLHVVDVQSYGMRENVQRTIPLSEEQHQTLYFAKYDYLNKRHRGFSRGSSREKVVTDELLLKGASYCTLSAFLANDPLGTSFFTLFWAESYNDYLMSICGKSPETDKHIPACVKISQIKFPQDAVAAEKISGHTADKIQFFSRAYGYSDSEEAAGHLREERFNGDVLFVEDPQRQIKERVKDLLPQQLSDQTRLELPYDVLAFTANRITVRVQGPQQPFWMMYSDAWHPYWTAKVNHKDASVYKAHLAYKAVQLPPGESTITFRFGSRLFAFLFALITVQSVLVLGLLLYYIYQILAFHNEASAQDPNPAA